MERVSALLGHSSLKVTERSYSPWVRERQQQLEDDVTRANFNDPIAQREMLRCASAADNGKDLRMTATYSRHEKAEFAN